MCGTTLLLLAPFAVGYMRALPRLKRGEEVVRYKWGRYEMQFSNKTKD